MEWKTTLGKNADKCKQVQLFMDWLNTGANSEKHNDLRLDYLYTIKSKGKIRPNHITEWGRGYDQAINDVFRKLYKNSSHKENKMKQTLKEKIKKTKELKETLIHHLSYIWDAPVLPNGHKIDLSEYIKEQIWRTVRSSLETAYGRGYNAGTKRGMFTGIIMLGEHATKDKLFEQKVIKENGKKFNQYFKHSTEELRQELCTNNLKHFRIQKSQLLDKFTEIKQMLEKQERTHEYWEHIHKR
jgi:hypothetical protein